MQQELPEQEVEEKDQVEVEVEAELLKERMPQRCRNNKTAMRQRTMMRDIILVGGDSMRFRFSPLSFSLSLSHLPFALAGATVR